MSEAKARVDIYLGDGTTVSWKAVDAIDVSIRADGILVVEDVTYGDILFAAAPGSWLRVHRVVGDSA